MAFYCCRKIKPKRKQHLENLNFIQIVLLAVLIDSKVFVFDLRMIYQSVIKTCK